MRPWTSIILLPLLSAAAVGADPVMVEEYKTWKLHIFRCWTDLRDGIRVLRDIARGPNSNAMTVEACLDACEIRGYSLGGVEFGRECFCGNTAMGTNYGENYYPPYATGSCSMPCTGNSSQICGGASAINIYVRDNYPFTTGMNARVHGGSGSYGVTQCWQDWNKNPRILKHQPSAYIDPTRMTVPACIAACAQNGWTSAGVEYGRECYCDNRTYPIGQSEWINECNMQCDGDASFYCGGPDRMLVYYNGGMGW